MIMSGAGAGQNGGGGIGGIGAYMNQGVPNVPSGFGSGVSIGSGGAPTNAGQPGLWGVTPGSGLGPWMSNIEQAGLLMRNVDPALLEFFNKMGGGGGGGPMQKIGGPYRHAA